MFPLLPRTVREQEQKEADVIKEKCHALNTKFRELKHQQATKIAHHAKLKDERTELVDTATRETVKLTTLEQVTVMQQSYFQFVFEPVF